MSSEEDDSINVVAKDINSRPMDDEEEDDDADENNSIADRIDDLRKRLLMDDQNDESDEDDDDEDEEEKRRRKREKRMEVEHILRKLVDLSQSRHVDEEDEQVEDDQQRSAQTSRATSLIEEDGTGYDSDAKPTASMRIKQYDVQKATQKCPFRVMSTKFMVKQCSKYLKSFQIKAATQLLSALIGDKNTSQEYIFRVGLGIHSSRRDNDEIRSILWSQFMQTSLRLDVNKREVLLEYLIQRLKDKELELTKKLLDENMYLVLKRGLRRDTNIDPAIRCYIAYVSFLLWFQETLDPYVSRQQILRDVQLSNMAQKAASSFKQILSKEIGIPGDMFLESQVYMSSFHNNHSEGFNQLSTYVDQNPENIDAVAYLYHYGREHGLINREKTNECFEKMSSDSPNHEVMPEMTDDPLLSDFDRGRSIMSLLEYIEYKENQELWLRLANLLKQTDSETLKLLRQHYDGYWKPINDYLFDLNQVNSSHLSPSEEKLLILKAGALHQLDPCPPSPFVLQVLQQPCFNDAKEVFNERSEVDWLLYIGNDDQDTE